MHLENWADWLSSAKAAAPASLVQRWLVWICMRIGEEQLEAHCAGGHSQEYEALASISYLIEKQQRRTLKVVAVLCLALNSRRDHDGVGVCRPVWGPVVLNLCAQEWSLGN